MGSWLQWLCGLEVVIRLLPTTCSCSLSPALTVLPLSMQLIISYLLSYPWLCFSYLLCRFTGSQVPAVSIPKLQPITRTRGAAHRDATDP